MPSSYLSCMAIPKGSQIDSIALIWQILMTWKPLWNYMSIHSQMQIHSDFLTSWGNANILHPNFITSKAWLCSVAPFHCAFLKTCCKMPKEKSNFSLYLFKDAHKGHAFPSFGWTVNSRLKLQRHLIRAWSKSQIGMLDWLVCTDFLLVDALSLLSISIRYPGVGNNVWTLSGSGCYINNPPIHGILVFVVAVVLFLFCQGVVVVVA